MKMNTYIIKLKEMTENKKEKKNLDKIGGYPTHLPPMNEYQSSDYFLMQIYNDKNILPYKNGVLCWQFYQDAFGGPIHKVIEVPVGAQLNDGNQIRKRRWIGEYAIEYCEKELEEDDTELISSIRKDSNIIKSNSAAYSEELLEEEGYQQIGTFTNTLCPDREMNLGTGFVRLVLNKKNKKLEVI